MDPKQYFHLTLIRHGETDQNVQGIVQGCMDTMLNEMGRNQASCLAKSDHFKDINKYTRIYSSDLRRAYDTCRILLGQSPDDDNCPADDQLIITDQLLRERSFGEMEGRSLNEIVKLAKQAGVPTPEFIAKGGESLDDVSQRMKRFLMQRLLPDINHGDHILIVSHGGIIRQMCSYLSSFDKNSKSYQTKVSKIPPNTSVNQFKVIYQDDANQAENPNESKKRSIIDVECILLHDIAHLQEDIQKQALEQPQINANVEC